MGKSTNQIENQEWKDSIKWLIEHEKEERVQEILDLLEVTAAQMGVKMPNKKSVATYMNTLPSSEDEEYPGDLNIENKIYHAIRWNAMAVVVNANNKNSGIGGHISTYSSASMLFEVGFQHFFRGYDKGAPDFIYFQGHASPGIYARSFVEHRLTEDNLNQFRLELSGGENGGLSSYPHPRLMSDYWRFPTVSMGLGPLQAIYQARFLKYLQNRGLKKDAAQKVWAFLGDGEMDEPESTGALAIASRDKLDNLIFVINCNLQRLDGPVRGNNKVIEELEGLFVGAGWKVIKVLWSSAWEKLFEKDKDGKLEDLLSTMPDGEFQKWAQMSGKELRKEVFEKDDDLKKISDSFSDDELNDLVRGGHDPLKVYNAYRFATNYKDGPVVILAQTTKGYSQGEAGEASNVAHKQKVFNTAQLKAFRDELDIPIEDEKLEDEVPYYRFDKEDESYTYLEKRRKELNGWLPARKQLAKEFEMPDSSIFKAYDDGSDEQEVTTTSVFVQILSKLLKDEQSAKHIVPIIPDEARTFGMDALFSKSGIYASEGQKYEPVDKDSLLYYNEKQEGVILEEGITEAGSMASFIAAGTNHIAQDFYTIPFFVFYSMFGFQRIGDLIWAAGDSRAKGFMIGGISGRTTLSGEGLQHTDGQSHLYAFAYPNVKAYDPAFAYELAVIIEEGIKQMYVKDKDHIYYITITNQSYSMPAIPKGAKKGIINGLYLFKKSAKRKNKDKTVNLMGSGAIITEVLAAAEMLEDLDIPTNIWSVTSYKALYDDAIAIDAKNRNTGSSEKSFIQESLEDAGDLFVAASDYVKAIPLTLAKWVPGDFVVLGTDGFGRSDTIPALRDYFEVDAKNIAFSALDSLEKRDQIKKKVLKDFQKKHKIGD